MNISERTAAGLRQLAPRVLMTSRGVREVKGKAAPMELFFLDDTPHALEEMRLSTSPLGRTLSNTLSDVLSRLRPLCKEVGDTSSEEPRIVPAASRGPLRKSLDVMVERAMQLAATSRRAAAPQLMLPTISSSSSGDSFFDSPTLDANCRRRTMSYPRHGTITRRKSAVELSAGTCGDSQWLYPPAEDPEGEVAAASRGDDQTAIVRRQPPQPARMSCM